MRKFITLIISGLILISCCPISYGQEVSISENLKIIKLTEHTYLHTSKDNNGIIFINKGEAIIVSTPETEIETKIMMKYLKLHNQIPS